MPLKTYFDRLSDIAGDAELRLEMIVHEFEYAQLFGEALDANEFADRFPDVRDRLLELIGCEQKVSVSPKSIDPNLVEPTVILGNALKRIR